VPSTDPSAPAGPLVHVDTVSKAYRVGDLDTPVLEGVSFDLGRSQTTSLVGASGSGKSTLLGLLAGLLRPGGGTIAFDGQDLAAMDDSERAALRGRRIGIVLQRGNLVPFLTAAENVELALRLAGRRGSGRRGGRRARSLLAELGVGERADHRPHQLSGGETQRVAVAVALANDPDLLLADEVTGELDSAHAEQVLDVIFEARRERGLTVLFVTHSRELAARADHRLRLSDGRVHAA
jgi:predicted ABC-type transport system involved in lysophospholipase L1 biosynthesis ATPase subunit